MYTVSYTYFAEDKHKQDVFSFLNYFVYLSLSFLQVNGCKTHTNGVYASGNHISVNRCTAIESICLHKAYVLSYNYL